MNNVAQESIESRSSKNASGIAVFKSTASPTVEAEDSSIWRTILDEHGRKILNFASMEFLDRAMALRLQTIGAKDLVKMLAGADRLGFSETGVISDDGTDDETVEAAQIRARSGLNATGTSTPLTPPSDSNRGPKRFKANRQRSPLVDGSHHKTPVLPSSNIFQRKCRPLGIRKSCEPQRHSASTGKIEVVVITDSEPEGSEPDDSEPDD